MSDFATRDDILRIDGHLKVISDALQRLVALDERQIAQAARVTDLENDLEIVRNEQFDTRRKLDRWVDRGVGAWAVVVVAWTIFELVVRTRGG